MDVPQTIVSLTEEERTLLEKRYFLVWTSYKWFTIGLTVVFGGLRLWTGWSAIYVRGVAEFFLFFTCILVAMIAFGSWATLSYKTRVALPLEQDLKENRKIQKIGQNIALKSIGLGRYKQFKLIFQAQGQAETEEFLLNNRIFRTSRDVSVLGKDMKLEYTPHARFLLSAQLLVPLTPEELELGQQQERTAIITSFILLGIIFLGMGWLFGSLMWLPLGIMYAVTIIIMSGIIWYSNRRP